MDSILKALADQNRLRILNLLLQKELCVCEIETLLDLSQTNVSRHLSKLKQASIIESEKARQWVHYRVNEDFKSLNKELFGFLEKNFLKSNPYRIDNKKLLNYNINNLNCNLIRTDLDRVIEIITHNIS